MEPEKESLGIRAAEFTVIDQGKLLSIIREIAKRCKTHIICFDADKLSGRDHAEMAVRLAERSFFQGTLISNSFEMEALLYASGSRQCNIAISFGLHDGKNSAYVCCCPDREDAWEALATHMSFEHHVAATISPEKITRLMELFGITPEEVQVAGTARVPDLVLERVALLEVSK